MGVTRECLPEAGVGFGKRQCIQHFTAYTSFIKPHEIFVGQIWSKRSSFTKLSLTFILPFAAQKTKAQRPGDLLNIPQQEYDGTGATPRALRGSLFSAEQVTHTDGGGGRPRTGGRGSSESSAAEAESE